MSRVTDDPFVKALMSDFRSQNIKAKGASVPFFHHIEAFVRSIEREVECRERGHVTAEVPRNAALYWGQVSFLLWVYKDLLHRATLQKKSSNEQFVKLFIQLYCTDAPPTKTEVVPEESQMMAVA
jgi:hypothetical protein